MCLSVLILLSPSPLTAVWLYTLWVSAAWAEANYFTSTPFFSFGSFKHVFLFGWTYSTLMPVKRVISAPFIKRNQIWNPGGFNPWIFQFLLQVVHGSSGVFQIQTWHNAAEGGERFIGFLLLVWAVQFLLLILREFLLIWVIFWPLMVHFCLERNCGDFLLGGSSGLDLVLFYHWLPSVLSRHLSHWGLFSSPSFLFFGPILFLIIIIGDILLLEGVEFAFFLLNLVLKWHFDWWVVLHGCLFLDLIYVLIWYLRFQVVICNLFDIRVKVLFVEAGVNLFNLNLNFNLRDSP